MSAVHEGVGEALAKAMGREEGDDLARARESIVGTRGGALEADEGPWVEVRAESAVQRVLRRLFPALANTVRRSTAEAYGQRASFVDMIPWAEFLEEGEGEGRTHHVLFNDGVSRMAGFEIDAIPTEGRSQRQLSDAMRTLRLAIGETLPEHERDPWVIQIYAGADSDLTPFVERMREYIRPHARGSAFSEEFLRVMEEHFRDVARAEGYFFDDEVSNSNWRGQIRRLRILIYRRYFRTRPSAGESPKEELRQACMKLESNLAALNVALRPITSEAFYRWMRDWWNPAPELCARDAGRLDEVAPYVTDPERRPWGADYVESMLLGAPRISAKRKLWYLDGQPHTVLMASNLTAQPQRGQITGEIEQAGARFAIADRLPPGTMIAMTIVIEPVDRTRSAIEAVGKWAWGTGSEASATRDEIDGVTARLTETGDKIYPMELSFYLRAPTRRELARHVQSVRSLLHSNDVRTLDPKNDLVQTNHFKRGLPGVYNAEIDRARARRARFQFVEDIAALVPLYGRYTGTGHPGLTAWTRSAEPFGFDPLDKRDRRQNAHLIVYGPTGAGKSAQLNYMMAAMAAVHRPRLFIIELGRSFELLGEYFAKFGLSVNQVRVKKGTRSAMPLFADTVNLVEKDKREIREESLEEQLARDLEDLRRDALEDEEDEDLERDELGEAEILATIMIRATASEAFEMTATMREVLQLAIIRAAENVYYGRSRNRTVLPEDVGEAIREVGGDRRFEDARTQQGIQEMASAMNLFCKGLGGDLFNREGELWKESDVTIVDLGQAGLEGNESILALVYISLLQVINRIAERDQMDAREIIVLTDEAHLVTQHKLLAPYVVKITKMWRKLGAWFWVGTQDLKDFPDEAAPMLALMEWWVALTMEKEEIASTLRFRSLTAEERGLIEAARKAPGKFVEGVIMCKLFKTLVRFVPPSIYLSIAGTEKHEKAPRLELMNRHGISELGAAEIIAREIRDERLRQATGDHRHLSIAYLMQQYDFSHDEAAAVVDVRRRLEAERAAARAAAAPV